MPNINPEIVARDIAKIFCEQQFSEIVSKAVMQWKKETAGKSYPGDPDVSIARALSSAYCCAYDSAYDEALALNCSASSSKKSK